MNTTRKRTKQITPLVQEDHPKTYKGYPFVTLLQFRQQHVLSIIDNSDAKTIKAFVLDFCGPEEIDESGLITIASEWYEASNNEYPLSIEFSKRGIASYTSKIYRTYNIEYISRVIGPLPFFQMQPTSSIKRRRRRALSTSVAINHNVIDF